MLGVLAVVHVEGLVTRGFPLMIMKRSNIRAMYIANPCLSLHWKNKHCYYAGTYPLYLRNGALGMQFIDQKWHEILMVSYFNYTFITIASLLQIVCSRCVCVAVYLSIYVCVWVVVASYYCSAKFWCHHCLLVSSSGLGRCCLLFQYPLSKCAVRVISWWTF